MAVMREEWVGRKAWIKDMGGDVCARLRAGLFALSPRRPSDWPPSRMDMT